MDARQLFREIHLRMAVRDGEQDVVEWELLLVVHVVGEDRLLLEEAGVQQVQQLEGCLVGRHPGVPHIQHSQVQHGDMVTWVLSEIQQSSIL